MATQSDVRRIALSLPETSEDGGFHLAVADELEKQALLSLDTEVFFTEPHYDGYPAVLVRLPAIDLGLLEKVLTDAWLSRAPRKLVDRASPG